MYFYKFSAVIDDEKWAEGSSDRRARAEQTRKLAQKSDEYREKRGDDPYFFVTDADDGTLTGGIISSDTLRLAKATGAFLSSLGVKITEADVAETTFCNIKHLLARASHSDFIDDDDDVLEAFGLDLLSGRNMYELDFSENIIQDKADKDALYRRCAELVADETLGAELDRIWAGKADTKAFGHPVHYMIECDGRETRGELSDVLLGALSANDRLNSRRVCRVDVAPGQRISKTMFNALYRSCGGGTVIVTYHAKDDSAAEDGGYVGGEMATVEALCEVMRKHRNSVLTVFCLPRVCERTKKTFFENLGDIGIVEIREDLADVPRAQKYLRHLCKQQHIASDKKLFAELEKGKLYLPDELRKIFDEWYNNKMRTSVYPQYKDLAVCRREAVKTEAKGSGFDELNELIGLAEAKAVINKAINYYNVQRLFKDKGVKQDRPAMHMVFTGNPGTAKTTVARLFARIMKENGLLSSGHMVEVGRADLVGQFVGQTAPKVKEKFKEAMGGVLFIDEAYSLVDDRHGLYGDEAINTIVQEMENRREDIVVIFAGYPEEMERFLSQNPGLRSRIAFHVPFADYDASELCEIARIIGKSKGVTFSDGAIGKLSTLFEAASAQRDFGNGRYVRNVIERSKMNLASRVCSLDVDDVTESILTTIEEEDVEVPKTTTAPRRHTIGFAS